MSDISIPGVSNSRFNTQKMIDDLMKLERIPLNRLEGRVETFKKQKVVWQQVNRSIGRLESAAKTLYGFQNPFQNRTGSSSDDSILTASATREAVESTTDIEIIQTAQADRFLSRSPVPFSGRGPYRFYRNP
jgi:flagellar hook-associated protein 2